MKKRILPALLALCMVMSLLPVAFAEITPEKDKCQCTNTSCAHADASKDTACTNSPVEGGTLCETCGGKAAGKDTTTTETKNEYVACSAVAAYAKTEEGLQDKEIGSDPHGEATCGASGCQCGIKVTAVTTTKNADGVVTKTETKVTYKYAGALCAACAKNAACNPCTGKDGCPASSHKDGCPVKCYFCANTAGATKVTVDDAEKAICDTCAKDAAKNPCGAGADKEGNGACTKVKGHTDKHNSPNCTGDIFCNVETHNVGCGSICSYEVAAGAGKVYDTEKAEWKDSEAKATCDRTNGHKGAHHLSADVCTGAVDCGASSHFPGVLKKDEDGKDIPGEYEEGKEPCKVLAKANQCGVGGCTLAKGHIGDHKNPKCLGYNDDGYCGVAAGEHIAGCKKYVECVCNHVNVDNSKETGADAWKAAATFTAGTCTEKADCPNCAAWNTFVTAMKTAHEAQQKAYLEDQAAGGSSVTEPSAFTGFEYCSCVACGAANTNPGMGAVVDADGNPVDPTDPTTPDVPTKAEDFTDMEDWMAADVQVALDKGWLQGNGDGTFNGRGVTTGTTIAAVLARMDGETITGSTWAQDALAWAEEQDVFEGVELTGDSMARKDLVLVIWRMAGTPDSEHELDFTDVDGLEGDHLTAMQWAVENGIVKGNGDGTVTPDGSVTRAALCAMLARYDALEK